MYGCVYVLVLGEGSFELRGVRHEGAENRRNNRSSTLSYFSILFPPIPEVWPLERPARVVSRKPSRRVYSIGQRRHCLCGP